MFKVGDEVDIIYPGTSLNISGVVVSVDRPGDCPIEVETAEYGLYTFTKEGAYDKIYPNLKTDAHIKKRRTQCLK